MLLDYLLWWKRFVATCLTYIYSCFFSGRNPTPPRALSSLRRHVTIRGSHGEPMGFSIRGGSELGLGIYVSNVRVHSPAGRSLTHSFHSFTHSFHSRTHSLSFSLCIALSLTHSLSLSPYLSHSLPHSLTRSLIHSFTHSLSHSLTYSLIHKLTHSLI